MKDVNEALNEFQLKSTKSIFVTKMAVKKSVREKTKLKKKGQFT